MVNILRLRLVKSRTYATFEFITNCILYISEPSPGKCKLEPIIKQLKNPDEAGYFKEWDGALKIDR